MVTNLSWFFPDRALPDVHKCSVNVHACSVESWGHAGFTKLVWENVKHPAQTTVFRVLELLSCLCVPRTSRWLRHIKTFPRRVWQRCDSVQMLRLSLWALLITTWGSLVQLVPTLCKNSALVYDGFEKGIHTQSEYELPRAWVKGVLDSSQWSGCLRRSPFACVA
jgi:hypothetical protein